MLNLIFEKKINMSDIYIRQNKLLEIINIAKKMHYNKPTTSKNFWLLEDYINHSIYITLKHDTENIIVDTALILSNELSIINIICKYCFVHYITYLQELYI